MTTPTKRPTELRGTGSYRPDEARGRIATIVYLLLKYVLLGPAMRVWMRADVRNKAVVDRVGGAVIVSNHQAFFDHFVLPLHLRRRVRYWAKSDWWGDGFKGRLRGWFFSINNHVPVDRSGGDGGQRAIDQAVECVRRGELFVIYPEGTRSPDGRVHRGRTGAVRVAIEGKVPIIPSAVAGLRELQPIGRRIPKRGRYRLVFGEPILLPEYLTVDDGEEIRRITDELMAEIVRLGELEYVDEYARRRE